MKKKIIIKRLKILNYNQNYKGFTLIELLVVVFIMGILAAAAIPNMFAQVGKARETEAKAVLGALNRAQQIYYTETASFADVGEINKLETPTGNSTYYNFSIIDEGIQKATGKNNAVYATRNYLGATQYTTDNRSYNIILCRSTNQASGYDLVATDVINAGVQLSSNVLACDTTNAEPAY